MPVKKKAKKNGEKKEMMISKSRVYRLVKGELEMRISAVCFETLSDQVVVLVKAASEKAKAEKRMTIKPRDFEVKSEDE